MRIGRVQRIMVLAALLSGFVSSLAFAVDFPPLTGRMVDQANVMTAQARGGVEAKSKDLDDKSGIQLVVATVISLHGGDIETYANELFRFWKIGQAQKNNGVLLLVAPVERKVRIEVGYGLEGTLTDALSSVIISSAIIPRFKTGDFSGGIQRGVDGIVSVLSGDTAGWQPVANVRPDGSLGTEIFIVLFLLVVISIIVTGIVQNRRSGRTVRRNGGTVFVPASGSSQSSSHWSSGDSSSSGGFSGDGGSSGGGGASGSW